MAMRWPMMDRGVDGEDEIEDEERHQDEMEGRIAANVITGALRFGHLCPLSVDGDCARGSSSHAFLGVPPPGGYLRVKSFDSIVYDR